jgi:hypothetical protein
MPDVTIRNETPQTLHIAFRFVAPASWTTSLEPGGSWTTHLGSVAYTVEVRLAFDHNRFTAEESLATAGNIVGAWAAGASSVILGMGGVLGLPGGLPGSMRSFAGASYLMNHAVSGSSPAFIVMF